MKFVFKDDKYQMNWFREDFEYAAVTCPQELEYSVSNRCEEDRIYTEISFSNKSSKPFFSYTGSIAIAFPLMDTYEDSETCLTKRCNTHIFCGGNISYIMALRMGGEAPHLGMVLTEGSFSDYSIERDERKQSNDRGGFWLHPSAMEFVPGETKKISWIVFRHDGKADFMEKLGAYSSFVDVRSERYVLFEGERNTITVKTSFDANTIIIDGTEIDVKADQEVLADTKIQTISGEQKLSVKDGMLVLEYEAGKQGEHVFQICVDNMNTWCRTFVHAPIEELAEKRCNFIADHQQYHGRAKNLQDAYLAYDNEEHICVYTPENDFNGGRERVGMGVLMARYLQQGVQDEKLHESLQRYREFVLRELVQAETGKVCNDVGMDDSYKRLYNAPWFAEFFTELYLLYKNKEDILCAYRIMKQFYQEGGAGFYPIELPAKLLYDALCEAGKQEEAQELLGLYISHAEKMIETGIYYPRHEVNYEQSIVAPAADVLLQVYLITGEEKYLEAAKIQIEVLDLFNGMQPDYHLYETAIRHWDGYWFGKRRFFGDTYPHYWSALTGNVFEMYGQIMNDQKYLKRAEDSRRGVLPMIFADGSASCAYVYPYSVNGSRAAFYDPYANDQDWGLYFYLRKHGRSIE